MNEGALLRQIEDAEPSASPCTLEWGSRYGGLVTIALLDGKAVAGISGPWSGKFALTWWERPLPARQLELFDTLEDAKHEVEAWATRMHNGLPAAAPAPAIKTIVAPVPATTAKIQALDKVNAQTTNLTVKVGQTATFESMTIAVKACVVRPPDQPADAAAFLQVTDNHPDAPGFTGWMLANEPAVSMMQSPIYDLRITGCS